jgi:hypothetical protein
MSKQKAVRLIPTFGPAEDYEPPERRRRYRSLTEAQALSMEEAFKVVLTRTKRGKITGAYYRNDQADNPRLKKPYGGQRYIFREQVSDTTHYVWQHVRFPRKGTGTDLFVQRLFLSSIFDNLSTAKLDGPTRQEKVIAFPSKQLVERSSDNDEPSEPVAA